ncbi:MAG: malto-oligosyltrehalose trehalohydrolase [Isosphaeraceae bacterium]
MKPLQPPDLGATCSAGRSCLVRVWAPLVPQVALRLLADGRRIVLNPEPHGYHAAVVEGVGHGDRYFLDIGNGRERPDPASRSQPDGVHGSSEIIDTAFPWTDQNWKCPELADFVIYELHVGTFTSEGTFDAAIGHLDRLRDLGASAIELMPLAQFPGTRNWGYDGVYPFAVQASYGGAAGLARFVDACHAQGLAVVLDVVYNHLGPEGNYLKDFAPYFTDQYRTPWGQAINFDGPGSDQVRAFFLANALMWQTDFHVDALRLDAVHAIKDFSAYPFLAELADSSAQRASKLGRPFYLIAESNLNDSRLVRPATAGGYGLDSMWSDDYHHALHTLLTGEREGYYEDFGRLDDLAAAYRCGVTYSGQYSPFRDRRHGNSPADLAPCRFVVSSQNHDQIGNRACGERLSTLCDWESLKLVAGLVLLSPFIPLLFMGEEYGETSPFLYFVNHGDPDLVAAVRKGRLQEFARFAWKGEVPDPQAAETFQRSKLNQALAGQGRGKVLHRLYGNLLGLRRSIPALGCRCSTPPEVLSDPERGLLDVLRREDGSRVRLLFQLGDAPGRHQATWTAGRWAKLIDSAETCWDGPGSALPDVISAGETPSLVLAPRSFAAFLLTSQPS